MSTIRNSQFLRKLTDHEYEMIQQKMQQCGIRNMSAYLRKMAIDGLLVSSYECDPASAEVDFLLSKQQYQIITGRQPKHGKDVIAFCRRYCFL